MANPEDSPSGEMSGWSIAGFGDSEHWNIVEGEDSDSSPPTDADLEWVDEIIIHIVDSEGVDYYYTMYGPWDDWDEFAGEVDDLYSEYGGEAT